VQKRDQVRAGTGLGLAIARGFVEAMDDHGGEPH
jgi:signal transduction histidine kinase